MQVPHARDKTEGETNCRARQTQLKGESLIWHPIQGIICMHLVDSNCTIFFTYTVAEEIKNTFLSSFIKLATVSERQAPPIHARPRLIFLVAVEW